VALGSSFHPGSPPSRPALYASLKVGDKVISPFTISCGECQYAYFDSALAYNINHSIVPLAVLDIVGLASLLVVFPLLFSAPLPCQVLRPNLSESLLLVEHCSHCPPHQLRLMIHYPFPKNCHTCQILPFFSLQTCFPLGFLSCSKLSHIPNLLRYSRASHGPAMWVNPPGVLFYRGAPCHICLPRTKFLTWALSGLVPLAL
jgi:hypothetical protein